MYETLLVTKFHIPPVRFALVNRQQPAAALELGRNHKLTLLSAPAGFGKTTLLSSWARSLKLPVAWLTLDQNDNDLIRFLGYLITALHRSSPDIDLSKLPIPETLQPDEIEPVAIPLLNEMASLAAGGIIILDDYHLIENSTIHTFLAYIIKNLPAKIHLYIATRSDPPLPLAGLRARNELVEIRGTDLRFKPAEIRTFLNQSLDRVINDDDLAVIESKTEGWAAALRLAALSLSKHVDVNNFAASLSGSHEYIAGYLADEVLAGQPANITSFLLQTSILAQLSDPLCRAVLADAGSQITLETLTQANLFIVPLDDNGKWFRYHQLFADLLRRRLKQQFPALIPLLHRRASHWYEKNELIDEALTHALAASDKSRATALIEDNIFDIILQGEFYQARRWLDSLPGETIQKRPFLLLAQAWTALRELSVEKAAQLVSQAEGVAGHNDVHRDVVIAHTATLRAMIARTAGEPLEKQRALIDRALAIVPPDHFALRRALILRRGLYHLDRGEESQADDAFRRVLAMSQGSPGDENHYLALYARTIIAFLQGRLSDAARLCRDSLQAAKKKPPLPWQKTAAQGVAFITLGLAELEWNQLADAEQSLSRGLALNTASGLIELQIKGQYALGRLRLAQGQRPAPLNLNKLAGGSLPKLGEYAAALQAHLWLLQAQQGDPKHLSQAVQWAAEQTLQRNDDRNRDWQVKQRLIQIRVLLAQPQETTPLNALPPILDRLAAACRQRGWVSGQIEAAIVQALLWNTLQQSEAALVALGQALTLAESAGYIRLFLDEGKALARLLYLALEQKRCPDYTGTLLAHFGQVQPLSPAGRPADALVEPLTPREIEVLRCIDRGYTNREIGQALTISLGTVKRHTANINSKLNVHSRTQAAAQARALGILD